MIVATALIIVNNKVLLPKAPHAIPGLYVNLNSKKLGIKTNATAKFQYVGINSLGNVYTQAFVATSFCRQEKRNFTARKY